MMVVYSIYYLSPFNPSWTAYRPPYNFNKRLMLSRLTDCAQIDMLGVQYKSYHSSQH